MSAAPLHGVVIPKVPPSASQDNLLNNLSQGGDDGEVDVDVDDDDERPANGSAVRAIEQTQSLDTLGSSQLNFGK